MRISFIWRCYTKWISDDWRRGLALDHLGGAHTVSQEDKSERKKKRDKERDRNARDRSKKDTIKGNKEFMHFCNKTKLRGKKEKSR